MAPPRDGTAGDTAAGATSAAASAAAPASASAPASDKTADGAYVEGRATTTSLVQVQRSIIRTASMTVRTKDVAGQAAKAEAATRALGGLVGNAAASTDPDLPENTKAVLAAARPRAPTTTS